MAMEVWPSAKIVMIEANPDKVAVLRGDPKLQDAKVIESLLGSSDGTEVTFLVMESGSSVFEENSGVERRSVALKQRRLGQCRLHQDRRAGL